MRKLPGAAQLRGRTRRGPASVRRPSRLVQRNLHGVTPPASRASNAGMRRAAAASARGPWPRGLTSPPLGARNKGGRLTAADMDPGRRQFARLSPWACGNGTHRYLTGNSLSVRVASGRRTSISAVALFHRPPACVPSMRDDHWPAPRRRPQGSMHRLVAQGNMRPMVAFLFSLGGRKIGAGMRGHLAKCALASKLSTPCHTVSIFGAKTSTGRNERSEHSR